MGTDWESLQAAERELLAATEPDRLEGRTAEELALLQQRVRSARDRYRGMYRRAAVRAVSQRGHVAACGTAISEYAVRAARFDDALCRVTVRMASVEAVRDGGRSA